MINILFCCHHRRDGVILVPGTWNQVKGTSTWHQYCTSFVSVRVAQTGGFLLYLSLSSNTKHQISIPVFLQPCFKAVLTTYVITSRLYKPHGLLPTLTPIKVPEYFSSTIQEPYGLHAQLQHLQSRPSGPQCNPTNPL